ncbi:phytoene desaturase family protein [Bdellovibrionota bacterium]
MKPQLTYDVVVVGGDLSGLVTAALLAKEGASVLVTNPGDQARSTRVGEYLFEEQPSWITGFKEGGAFNHLISKLGLSLIGDTGLLTFSSPPYLASGSRRYSWTSNPSELQHELKREYQDSHEPILHWHSSLQEIAPQLNAIIEKLLTGQIPSTKWLRGEKISPRKLRRITSWQSKGLATTIHGQVLNGALSSLSYLDPKVSDNLPFAFWNERLKDGVGTFRGGIDQFRRKLLQVVSETEGDIVQAHPQKLYFEENTFQGMELSDGKKVKAKFLIANEGIASSYKRLSPHIGKKRWEPTKKLPMSYWRNYYFTVREEGIPDYLSHTLVTVDNEKNALTNGNLMTMTFSHPDDPTRAPEGERILTASYLIDPKTPTSDTPDIVKKIRALLPFFPEFLTGAHPITAPTRVMRRPLRRPAVVGDPLRHWTPPFSNVYYAGPELYPEFGAEGEILSGLRINRLIQSKR